MIWLLFWSLSIVHFSILSISIADVLFPEEQGKILDDHNEYRKQHHVAPLEWSEDARSSANTHVDFIISFENIYYDTKTSFGQNIWEKKGLGRNGFLKKANPVYSWYLENQFYPDEPYPKWRQFAQLIWKSTKSLGCAVAYKSDRERVAVVCNYDPPGNDAFKRHENIFTVHGIPWVNKNDSLIDSSRGESIPFWMYGLGFSLLLMMVLLAIYIYYKRKPTEFTESELEAELEAEADSE